MLRFALRPTADMHIGDLRVALFNSIVSAQRGEPLIVRIEDADTQKNIEGKEKEILDILALFNIEYKEILHQSSHLKYHRAMAIGLLHDKQAFNCFCTLEQLNAKNEYDDTCRYLSPEETIDNFNPFTIRLNRPENDITIIDKVKGEIAFCAKNMDSFVIMTQEKYPTYDFACAIDDMISDISLVILEEDHMQSTPKQIAIRNALGYDKAVEYAHLSLILNSEGKKMSKDDDASNVKWLLEEGYLPDAITNYLILIGNKTPKEIFTLEEAITWFNLKLTSTSPAHFNMDKLRFINREHLKLLDAKELSRYVGFADDEIGKLAQLYLEEASTLKELRSKISPIFEEKVIPEMFQESVGNLRKAVKSAPYFDKYEDFEKYTIKESGLKGDFYVKSLRLILTGSQYGPEVSDIYMYLKNYLAEVVK